MTSGTVLLEEVREVRRGQIMEGHVGEEVEEWMYC